MPPTWQRASTSWSRSGGLRSSLSPSTARSLRDVTAELVSAAAGWAAPVAVAVLGGRRGPLAAQANLPGVDEVIVAATPADGFAPDAWRAAAELIAQRSPRPVLGALTVDAMASAPPWPPRSALASPAT